MEVALRDGRGLGINWVSRRCTGAVLACKHDGRLLGLTYLVSYLLTWFSGESTINPLACGV